MKTVKTVTIYILCAALLTLSVFYFLQVSGEKGRMNFYESQMLFHESQMIECGAKTVRLKMKLEKYESKN